ncbi:cob(I)alamin adenosyltransferase [Sporobacter termitidis DSM 10068]|uniref:Cob(I)alamin adenosyltransferase n=1 Tax=Sporobacter termitidis DSM 10068 TaxID=1123282 RepID=A0A1M5X382_9FIRM|nr:cob(I)yrinic acid a,c-diamide adenosyltransferase [Sporobacter termitidis]SHH94305.1 cob(I)alamin adenosyltransferase [Sporobacter termitidis DSM 10068]
MSKGLIHVYYGYGKGKTTAALGLALRAAGCGLKVVIVQFLKDSNTGELNALKLLPNVTVLRGTAARAFTRDMTPEQLAETRKIQNANFEKALELVGSGECGLLILDEALDAYQLGLLDKAAFLDLVCRKPDSLELVITGHRPDEEILGRADYVTEMVKVRHPYDSGISARRGIEF